MDLRRLRIGEWGMGLAGLAVLVSLFLPWYQVEVPGKQADELTGWAAFAVTDVLLAALALAALATIAVVARAWTPSPGIAYESLVLLATLVVLVVCLFRLIDPPGDFLTLRAGSYLGFAALLVLLGSTLVAMRDERVGDPAQPTDPTGVPVAQRPEIETLPAPRA